MPRLAWAAAAVAAVVLIGTAGTEARWTDTATIPGATLQTPAVVPPDITCGHLLVSWSAVPGATAYDVMVAGIKVLTLPATALSEPTTGLGLGLLTVRAEFGSWVSGPSQQTCSLA